MRRSVLLWRHDRVRKLVLLIASAALASTACGNAEPRVASPGAPVVDAVKVELGAGQKAAAYDPARDVIWIVTRDRAGGPVELSRFAPMTGELDTKRVSDTSRDFSAAALAIDGQGFVWFGWGSRVSRYDPSRGHVKTWHPPQEDLGSILPGPSSTLSFAASGLTVVSGTPDGSSERPLVTDGDAVWSWRAMDGRVQVLRTDAVTGATSAIDFPAVTFATGELNFPVPPGVSPPSQLTVDPDLQALVVDKRHDAWLLTGWGGAGAPYASLYRLH